MVDDEPPFTHHLKVRPYRGIEKALDRHNELLATIAAQAAELEALRGEVEPVDAFMSERNEILRLEKYKLETTITQLRARNAALEEGLGGIRDGIILIRMLFELEEECDNRAAELTRHINALLNQNGEA